MIATSISQAWVVLFTDGFVEFNLNQITGDAYAYVWCVRGGQGHDAY